MSPRIDQPRLPACRLHRGFTLLELLLCVTIIAVLLGIMVPALSKARKASYAAACANNLRQIGLAFSLYTQDNADRLPSPQQVFPVNSDWKFGGLDFVGSDRTPVLASTRPINKYVDDRVTVAARNGSLFSCPADIGVWERRQARAGEPAQSILPARTCFRTFGNSYRSNPLLLSRGANKALGTGVFDERAYALHEVTAVHSRVLLVADPVWFYATRPPTDGESQLDASWHARINMGNMLALDGSVRLEDFGANRGTTFVLEPR